MRSLLVTALAIALIVAGCDRQVQGPAPDIQATIAAAVQATQRASQQAAQVRSEPTVAPTPTAVPTMPATSTPTATLTPTEVPIKPTLAPTPAIPTPEPTVTLVNPTLAGRPVVLTNSYSIGEIAYDTAVAFRVRNPNRALAIFDMPYRVTVSAGNQRLYTSDGTDSITLQPGETRLVVFRLPDDPTGTRPTSAIVRLYPSPHMFASGPPIREQASWRIDGQEIQCPEMQVQCELVGDLTWRGKEPRNGVVIHMAIRGRQGPNAPIIAAGTGSPQVQQIEPGQTVPFSIVLTGFDQPQEGAGAAVPKGPTSTDGYVQSSPAIEYSE